MSGVRWAGNGPSGLPGTAKKNGQGFLPKLGFSKKQKDVRLSQFVDPQIIQDGPSSADNSRLDVIDQLDISGLTGGSCTYFVANLFSIPSRFSV